MYHKMYHKMYRISRHIIKAAAPAPHIPGLEGAHATQLPDICYFVLNSPKRETAHNSMPSKSVILVGGTRVVHFSENVVHGLGVYHNEVRYKFNRHKPYFRCIC